MQRTWQFGLYFCVVKLMTGCAFIDRFEVYAPTVHPETAWKDGGKELFEPKVSRVAFKCAAKQVVISHADVATHPYLGGPIIPVIPTFFFPGVKSHPPKFYVRVQQDETAVRTDKIKPQAFLTDAHGNVVELTCSTPTNLLGDPRGSRVMGYSFQVSLPEEVPGETFTVKLQNVVEGCELPLLKFEKKSFTRFYYTGF